MPKKSPPVPTLVYPPLPEMRWDAESSVWQFDLEIPELQGHTVSYCGKKQLSTGVVQVKIEQAPKERFPSDSQVAAVEYIRQNLGKLIDTVLEGCLNAYITLRAYNQDDYPDEDVEMPDIRTTKDLLGYVILLRIYVYLIDHRGYAFTGFDFDSELEMDHGFGVRMWKGTVEAYGSVDCLRPPRKNPKNQGRKPQTWYDSPTIQAMKRLPRSTPTPQPSKANNRSKTASRASKKQPRSSTSPSTTSPTPVARRYYFDDGSSRKFGSISQQRAKQTIEYGRLGSTGRPIDKKFATEIAATADTEKLIAEKVAKGYKLIDPSLLGLKRAKGVKSATIEQVEKLEKQLGAKLPHDYRQFLLTQNGGMPESYFVNVTGHPNIENVMVGYLRGLRNDQHPAESLAYAVEHEMPCLPKGHLPIARASDIFSISLKDNLGAVYFWDQESPEDEDDDGNVVYKKSDGYLLAGSFDEFLTRIALFESQDED